MPWAMGNERWVLRKVWMVENNGEDSLSSDIENLLKKKGTRLQIRGKEGPPLQLQVSRTPEGWGSPSLKALLSPSTGSKHFSLSIDIVWLIKECASMYP